MHAICCRSARRRRSGPVWASPPGAGASPRPRPRPNLISTHQRDERGGGRRAARLLARSRGGEMPSAGQRKLGGFCCCCTFVTASVRVSDTAPPCRVVIHRRRPPITRDVVRCGTRCRIVHTYSCTIIRFSLPPRRGPPRTAGSAAAEQRNVVVVAAAGATIGLAGRVGLTPRAVHRRRQSAGRRW